MRILVTGATGFVGGALARRLAGDGHVVRALARGTANAAPLVDGGIEVVVGDVRDRDALAAAVRDCTHVVHLAAAKSGSASLLEDVNVRGTANLIDVARSAGVERVVYGSTLGVHGFVAGPALDERSPVRPNTPYRRSKWRAERLVREANARSRLPAVVARISSVVGDGATGWLPFVRDIAAGRMRLIGDGSNSIDLVAIDDLVDGLARCVTTPALEGRCYVLGAGEPSTVATFASTIASALGVPAPSPGLPAGPFRAAQRLASSLFRLTGLGSAYVHDREALVADKRASSALARAELGYDPHSSMNAAVRAMVAGFVARGRVPERALA